MQNIEHYYDKFCKRGKYYHGRILEKDVVDRVYKYCSTDDACTRIINAFKRLGVYTLDQLKWVSVNDFAKVRGVGPVTSTLFEQIKLDKGKKLIDIETPCVPIDISNVDMLCRFFAAEISSKSKDVITVKMPDSDQLLYLPKEWCNKMYIKMEGKHD